MKTSRLLLFCPLLSLTFCAWGQIGLKPGYRSDFDVPFTLQSKDTSLNSSKFITSVKNQNSLNLSRLEDRLILNIGRFYHYRLLSSTQVDTTDSEAKLIRGFLRQAIQAYATTAILTGKIDTAYLKKESLFSTNLAELPDPVDPTEVPFLLGETKGIKLTRLGSNLELTVRRNGMQFTEACLTYVFSVDSSLVAFHKPDRITIRQVNTGLVVNELLKKITTPTYCFSTKSNQLYLVDQANPLKVIKMDAAHIVDSSTTISNTLARYRIDQILPDDDLLVARRILNGQTFLQVLNFNTKDIVFTNVSKPLPYLVNECRVESIIHSTYLLAAYRVENQGYTLLLANSNTETIELAPKAVKEYRLDRRGNLVILQADSKLSIVDIHTPTRSNPIDSTARYFDIQGNTLVYWKQHAPNSPDKWDMHVYQLDTKSHASDPKRPGFQYDTNLRRDVPRLTLRDNYVYFVDRSNQTINKVKVVGRLIPALSGK